MPVEFIGTVRRHPVVGIHIIPDGVEGQEAMGPVLNLPAKINLVTQGRNLDRLRKFFALLNAIYPHQDLYPTMKILREEILIGLGFCDVVTMRDGRTKAYAHSIAFGKMEEPDFSELLDRTVRLIYERVIPGVGSEELMKRVNEICEGR